MRSGIKAAGNYLLSVLKTDRTVSFSRFYNADPGTDTAIAESIRPFLASQPVEDRGEPGEDDDHLAEEAPMLLDWAAEQLADLGVVNLTFLAGKPLIDGEPDFRIDLTERGQHFIDEGKSFGYRMPSETRYDVREASHWMISLLFAGDPGQDITLNDVMDPDHTVGLTMVTDDYGNVYPPGSNSYAWGFEVCLWHHARNGNIEPVPEHEDQRRAWEEYVARGSLPPRPDLSNPRPLWDVPFRLVGDVDTDVIKHVGSISD